MTSKFIGFARTDTAIGLENDEKFINADYVPIAGNWMGRRGVAGGNFYFNTEMEKELEIVKIPQLRGDTATSLVGFDVNEVAFGSGGQHTLSDEYVLDPECMKIGKSPEKGLYYMHIYEDRNIKADLVVRSTLYAGAKVTMPKGLGKIQNVIGNLV